MFTSLWKRNNCIQEKFTKRYENISEFGCCRFRVWKNYIMPSKANYVVIHILPRSLWRKFLRDYDTKFILYISNDVKIVLYTLGEKRQYWIWMKSNDNIPDLCRLTREMCKLARVTATCKSSLLTHQLKLFAIQWHLKSHEPSQSHPYTPRARKHQIIHNTIYRRFSGNPSLSHIHKSSLSNVNAARLLSP